MIYDLQMTRGWCVTIDSRHFVKERLKKRLLKYAIYIFRLNGEPVYVGESSRGLYRCIHGLSSNKQTDTYPWKNHPDVRNAELQLLVLSTGLPQYMARSKKYREALEADVAQAIYRESGGWPRKLTQIKVQGGIERNKHLRSARDRVVHHLKEQGWL